MYEPPTAPLRRGTGSTVAIVAGVLFAVCCIAGATVFLVGGAFPQRRAGQVAAPAPTPSPDDGVGAAGPAQNPADGPALPGLRTPVRDGKFEFVVSSLSCGHASVGKDWFKDEPQGQFCVAEITVTNIGTEAQRFADGNQRAFGPEGNMYAADTSAGVVVNGSGDAIWNVVNPGNSLTAKVVWDIPVSATITVVELHDSLFSGGVKVQVA